MVLTKLIKVSAKTQQRLKDLGKKDETYDQIITRLYDFWHLYKIELRA